MPHLLGEVMAVSGEVIIGKKIMDWGFVKLDDAAVDYSRLNRMFTVPNKHQPQHYDPDLGLPLPAGHALTEFGTLEKGGYYVKLGRSTGVTGDICHGTPACCHLVGRNRVRMITTVNKRSSHRILRKNIS